MKTPWTKMLRLPIGKKSEGLEPENSICRDVVEIVGGPLLGAGRRRRPPNWSVDLWMREIKQVAIEAGLEAERDYDGHTDVGFAAFVYQRVRSKLRDYCRKEWGFGSRTARDGL